MFKCSPEIEKRANDALKRINADTLVVLGGRLRKVKISPDAASTPYSEDDPQMQAECILAHVGDLLRLGFYAYYTLMEKRSRASEENSPNSHPEGDGTLSEQGEKDGN